MQKDILAYYKKFESKEAPFWLVPIVIVVAVVFFIFLIPYVLLRELFCKIFHIQQGEEKLARYWMEQDVQFIIGYDSNSKFAKSVIERIKDREDIRFFDWNRHKGKKLKALYQLLPKQEKILRAFKYGIDYDSVVAPPFGGGEKTIADPIDIYAMAISSKHKSIYMLTAHPYLDNWSFPEEVLSDEEFLTDFDEDLRPDKNDHPENLN